MAKSKQLRINNDRSILTSEEHTMRPKICINLRSFGTLYITGSSFQLLASNCSGHSRYRHKSCQVTNLNHHPRGIMGNTMTVFIKIYLRMPLLDQE